MDSVKSILKTRKNCLGCLDENDEFFDYLNTAQANTQASRFPDFVFEGGFIEHFQVSTAKETSKGSAFKREEDEYKRQTEKNCQEYTRQWKSEPFRPNTITTIPHELTFDKNSYEYFMASFKRNFENHIDSLQKYNGQKEKGIFLIEKTGGMLFIDGTYPTVSYSLFFDKNLLEYIYKFKDVLQYVVFTNKKDVELESYKLGQAMRLTNLVCKILPGFNHRLKKNEKEDIVKNIYVLPNKIIFNVLRSLDEDFEKIVKTIQEMLNTENEEVSEEEIKKAFIRAAETFILNTYDQSARLSVTDKTMPAIELFDRTSTNYTIQHIMMRENLGDFKGFTSQADKLYDKTELSIVKSMITRIVHKHFLYHKKLRIVGDVERVAKKYFGESVKKVDFLK